MWFLSLWACYVSDAEVAAALDRDGDGYRTFEAGGRDCDDADKTVHPDAQEICGDNVDNDCDGRTDDQGVGAISYYPDSDRDGVGVASGSVLSCSSPGEEWATSTGDCRDDDASIRPGADDVCDGVDRDCDGVVDSDADFATVYRDADGDGLGSLANGLVTCQPLPIAGYVENSDDCDDADPGVGMLDWYADLDGDSFGDRTARTAACSAPSGFVSDASDCDDSDDTVNPAAEEICDNGVDDNCDGSGVGCGPLDPSLVLGAATASVAPLEFAADRWVAFPDMNGDGRSEVGSFLNLAFSDGTQFRDGLLPDGAEFGWAGDLNADGRAELSYWSASEIWLVEGGDVSAATPLLWSEHLFQPSLLESDSCSPSMLTSQVRSSQVSLHDMSGLSVGIEYATIDSDGQRIRGADLTGDGCQEWMMLLEENDSTSALVYEALPGLQQQGDHLFREDGALSGKIRDGYGQQVGDIDGDGIVDLIVGTNGSEVQMFANLSSSPVATIGHGYSGFALIASPRDLDGDGSIDLIVGVVDGEPSAAGVYVVPGPVSPGQHTLESIAAVYVEGPANSARFGVGAFSVQSSTGGADLLMVDEAGAVWRVAGAGL